MSATTPGPLGHAFTEGWLGKPERCYYVVSPADANGKYDIRCGKPRAAHLPPVGALAVLDRLRQEAIRVVDNWECAEQETMRDGHRESMERQIRAALERVVRECVGGIRGANAEAQSETILAKWGLKQ